MKINDNFSRLKDSYLFKTIKDKVNAFQTRNPEARILRLGIGDVTRPIAPVVVREMKRAVREMARAKTFQGYGDEQGLAELRRAVARLYPNISAEEVFISDGAKSDLGNILEIFDRGITVCIPDPVYPAYVDANIMSGNKIVHELCPEVDIVYVCSPNNPTGEVKTHAELCAIVDWAIENDAVVLFDGAYRDFIYDTKLPRSIFEIPRARECAIEINSFSKSAGFTGLRCGWTIVPRDSALYPLWLRRQTTKFNGASYIIQRGAIAALSLKGRAQNGRNTDYYMTNALLICNALKEQGIEFVGGIDAPYIWLKCPNGMGSWEYFDYLLEKFGIVGTPGAGFGTRGEGWFRLSAFGKREDVVEAIRRLGGQ